MLFPIIVVGAAVYSVRKLSSGESKNKNSKNKALEILNTRYANGEISDEEYNKKKSIILG